MQHLTVIVSEPAARAAIAAFLTAECPDDVRVAGPENVPETGSVLWVGAGGESIPAGQSFKTPLRIGALLDRIHAHIRARANDGYQSILFFGPYSLDCVNNSLSVSGSKTEIRLTEKEKSILQLLMTHNGERVERRVLLDEVWGYGENIETHTLETHIYRLRQKVEKNPAAPLEIVTEESGYRIKIQE